VIAYHRWREGTGDDVVVVASFSETTWRGYEIGFPFPCFWKERFNSDAYDHWVNPQIAGNGGSIVVHGSGLHGFPASAPIVLPANSVVVFDRG
jgi:1,4-alpha-glucan branching enzyme